MKKKARILLISYLSVLIVTLSLYAWAGQWGLGWYRRTVGESAGLAYEETVRSVQTLSSVLDQSPYATDAALCDRICCEAYACSAAAESALATLPFSTWELERLSAFLNTAGDYAHSLCGQGEPFSEGQRRELGELAAAADEFSRTLLDLRQALQDRELRMDSREQRLRNVGEEPGEPLSGELLRYEAGFQPLSLHYDGKYGAEPEDAGGGLLTEAEMLSAAADFAGVPASELELAFSYEGTGARRCYRTGDINLYVDRSGVRSMSCSRVVPEEKLSEEQARQAAEDFLRDRGYEGLVLLEQDRSACVVRFTFAREQNGVLIPDNRLLLSVALDDGSLTAFDASDYDPRPLQADFPLTEDEARDALPAALAEAEGRPMLLRSPGGELLPCYVFTARDDRGRSVEISISAETGRQQRIRVG